MSSIHECILSSKVHVENQDSYRNAHRNLNLQNLKLLTHDQTRRYPRGIQILVSTYLKGAEFAGGGGGKGFSGQVKIEKS